MNISATLFVQRRACGAAPRAASNSGIMISGNVCSLCPQRPHYSSRESLASSLKMDSFRDILLIHIVSFESLRVFFFAKERKSTRSETRGASARWDSVAVVSRLPQMEVARCDCRCEKRRLCRSDEWCVGRQGEEGIMPLICDSFILRKRHQTQRC